MIIGIDIDDTLVSTSESFNKVLKKYNVNFNKNFKDEWTKEERNFIYDNYLKETLISAEFKENAKMVLDYLNDKGYKIIIITARSNEHCSNIEELTKKIFNENNINISEFYFGQSKKSDLAKELNVDLMIDDNISVYKNMQEENIDCILFGDSIKLWKDVLEYIERR